MNTEKMVQEWFEEYDSKMASLKVSYDLGFEYIKLNKAGEASPESLLDLNQWYTEQRNKIRMEMTEKAQSLFSKAEGEK